MGERRTWIRVPLELFRALWPRELVLARIWLQAMMVARVEEQGSEAGWIQLGAADLRAITGRSSTREALADLERIAQLEGFSLTDHGTYAVVHWPGFSGRAPRRKASSGSGAGVELCWEAAREEARRAGRDWRLLTPARRAGIGARLAEHAGEDPGELGRRVVQGYLRLRRDPRADPPFAWRTYLTPETLFRPSKFEGYVEAGEGDSEVPETPPLFPGKKQS